ncbi:MAG TPA: SDR family NAD(P)-dependent oxidoreductase, partial [Micromonosporaceae bacterium]|nr:SDR family NAD(P)-dependent oxidoreductase [Micromonosporaceae bacterium]
HPPAVSGHPLGQVRRVLRWMSQARHTGKLVLDVPAGLDPQGTVLVTGGTGTLGGLVAQHLVRAWGVRHLLLASRRGEQAPGVGELAGRLRGLGARVRVVAVDVADPAAVARLVAGVDPEHPLTGVVHAAGVIEDAVLASQARQGLARVWRAKATAAVNLHLATRDLRLGMFVVFSSAAGVLGSAGQANYAAANAFCDALAVHRQATGLAGLSVAWGLWAATSGMTGQLRTTDHTRMNRSGVAALSTEHGLRLLDSACQHGAPNLLAANLDLRALAAQPAHTLPAALRTLAAGNGRGRERPAAATAGVRPDDLASRLAGLSGAEQHRVLLNLVRGHVATVLGHVHRDAVQAHASFKELGFDSLTAVELRNRLAAATGLRLPPALVFDYPQAGLLADHLRQRICAANGTTSRATAIEPVLDELARLERVLNTAVLADGDSSAVVARLESLLARWRVGRLPESGATTVDQLDGASADQVLEFIDNELGVS